MKQKTTGLILLGLSTVFPVGAVEMNKKTEDETAKPLEIPESGWSNGAFLGPNWWLKNPKNLESVPHLWLYHVDLSYAYSKQGGNIDVASHRGNANLYLRRDLLSSITTYDINNRNTTINLTEKDTEVKNSSFRQGFRYALNDKLAGVVGFLWEQNSGKYIDKRTVWYSGLRYHPINTDKYDLMLGLFYAPQSDTVYMNDSISELERYKTFLGVEDYSSDAMYLAERFDWQLTDVISFTESLDYMSFLEDSEYYFLKLNLKLDFKFNKLTSFFISYMANYDNNSFVKGLDDYLNQRKQLNRPAGEIETLDTSLDVGVKFSF